MRTHSDEIQRLLSKVCEILDEHWNRMEADDQTYRELRDRVARLEASALLAELDEIPVDNPAPASPEDYDLVMDLDPDTPGRWVRADAEGAEDTEGLPVVAHQIFDGGHHYYSDGPTYNGRSTPLVRLSDAVERGQRLTARLESVERERDELDAKAKQRKTVVGTLVAERAALERSRDKWKGRSKGATRQRDEWKAHWRGRLDELTALTTENRTLRQRLEGMEVTPRVIADYLVARALQGEGEKAERLERVEEGGADA